MSAHPHDSSLDMAQRAVLGACFKSRDAQVRAVVGLQPEHFVDDGLRAVFGVVRELASRGDPVDPLTVATEGGDELLEAVGGPGVIDELAELLADLGGSPENVPYHITRLQEAYRARLEAALPDRIRRLMESGKKPEEALEIAREEIESAAGDDDMIGGRALTEWDINQYLKDGPPAPEWVVVGWWTRGQVVAVVAPKKTGKSTLTTALSVGLAMGRSVGQSKLGPGFVINRPHLVVYCDRENPARSAANRWWRHGGLEAIRSKRLLLVDPKDVLKLSLKTDQGIHDIRATIRAHQRAHPEVADLPVVIVLDSFVKFANEANENSSEDRQPVMDRLRRLAALEDATVLVHFNTGKDEKKGVRGHISAEDQIDAKVNLKKRQDGSRYLEPEDMRGDFPAPPLHDFEVEYHDDDDPIQVRIYATEQKPYQPDSVDLKILKAIRVMTSQSSGGVGPKDLMDAVEQSDKNVGRHLKSLEAAGYVINDAKGKRTLTAQGEALAQGKTREVA